MNDVTSLRFEPGGGGGGGNLGWAQRCPGASLAGTCTHTLIDLPPGVYMYKCILEANESSHRRC